ncbi:MAG: metallophosphoesterase [Lentisphaeria bacterium]|nr:metallophosphoesterase [Lentisphaeria bacterium]
MNTGNECLLRVGIVSDVQMDPRPQDWGERNLEKAFSMLSSMKIDLLLHGGDLANGTNLAAFEKYSVIKKAVFGENAPPEIFCSGNHEFWSTKDRESALRHHVKISSILSQKPDNPLHEVIRGYDFIALSDENAPLYGADMLSELKKELDKAVARDGKKPVFLLTHFPPAETMAGSYRISGASSRELRKLLNDYPQVISFSGHTHDPLENECAIWQKEFTAVTTATLSYGCSGDYPYYNTCNTILPYAREALEFMMMEIYADRILLHRYHAEDEREIKPEKLWSIPLPFQEKTAPFTFRTRFEKAVPPAFAPGTKLWIRPDYGYLYLVFDPASHPDHVHSYFLRIGERSETGENWIDKGEYRYIAPFYRKKENRGGHMVMKLPGEVLLPGKEYRFSVTASEDFGKESIPLSVEFLMPQNKFKDGTILCPQE